ncbi:hypothetical protein CVT24_005722 [Panaeolus cyanescens]|uniref:Uncharacterized protein n=1 Tax=Panaeolus cyanescens TaxID=181874 RepID=A0A409VEA5_9AGAR|nr:hypothetical protein CVT24_005722 [Panaeolus cyanescens]
MASLNSEHHHGQQPTKLARQNSSFLGAIKNIVTAPLNWFGNPVEDDETSGKRRRPVEQTPTEPSLSMDVSLDDDIDDATRRSKRMRLHSPPRTTQHYLDPPAAALRNDKMRRTSVVPRASSAVLPSTRSGRATLSPHRRVPVSRTMSIDPPHLPPRRDASFNFGSSDVDMSIPDISMPPSPRSPRPSFRMRSSLTPQPQQLSRHISEPPPLNSLVSNPHFVQPPSQPVEPKQAPTLGTLVESVRTVRSPTRHQHASLLLAPDASSKFSENKEEPAQRALSQLDIYKTPLLPTRLRSSNLPASIIATKTPDMFKSKRGSHLVLMHDDGDRPGRKGTTSSKSPVVNETKPYAGEGGMKKLLARRKVEVEEGENESAKPSSEDTMEGNSRRRPSPSPPPPPAVPKVPESTSSDWFSVAASSVPSTGTSSLRVGRTKISRNHIHRPSRARFSAVYDDEGDDAMDDDREKERKVLEEAAKKAPVFQIPEGFSFAKDAPVPTGDLATAKEPPISALPFSFAKPATVTPSPASLFAPPKPEAKTVEPESRQEAPSASTSAPTFSFDAKPAESQGGIPNFFAKSQLLAKATPPPPVPTILNFGAPTPSDPVVPAPAQSFLFGQPVKDKESPFWDGEKKEQKPVSEQAKPANAASEPVERSSAAPLFPLVPPASTSAQTSNEVHPAPPAPPFSFSGFGEKKQESTVAPLSNGAPGAGVAPTFGTTDKGKSADVPISAPKPLFGNLPAFGETKPATSNNIFGGAASTPSSSTPFTFGGPAKADASAPEVPKPSPFAATPAPAPENPAPASNFGTSPFSFGAVTAADKTKENKSTPFTFGTPTTSTTEVKPAQPAAPAPFSFGQTASTTPATTSTPAFSFSGTAEVPKPAFSFGQPAAISNNAMDSDIERPVTPPKNADQEFRMEESPTRDLQQSNNKPMINGGFSFSAAPSTTNTTAGSIFGDRGATASPLPTPAPFTFGATTASNPFGAKEAQPAAPKPFAFGTAAAPAPITTSFSFGQPKAAEEPARPATAGGFSFGATPTSTTAPVPAFSFGAPTATNAFGSAPSSPSTFNQPTPFSFGNPAPAASSPFTFGGSQPASPAGGVNLTLPQTTTSGFGTSTTGFGQATTPQPSSPFSAPTSLAPSTSSGGTLFTIGAAPAPAPNAAGARQIKKLPARRAGAKR